MRLIIHVIKPSINPTIIRIIPKGGDSCLTIIPTQKIIAKGTHAASLHLFLTILFTSLIT